MNHQKQQGPVDQTGPSTDETADQAIVAVAEKTGNPEKRKATLLAKFALRGFAVLDGREGYFVVRWGMAKHCASLDDLEAFAHVVGAS